MGLAHGFAAGRVMLRLRTMSGLKRLLLVDDDATLRQSLAEQLIAEFETVQVASGKAALDAVQADRFDAILLDVGLPDLDGHDVCRQLRTGGTRIPIIMLTAAAA